MVSEQKATYDVAAKTRQGVKLERLTNLANKFDADGVFLVRGARQAELRYYQDPPEVCPYCGNNEFDDVFTPPEYEADVFRCQDCDRTWENTPIALAIADASLLIIMRFPLGDDGEPGIEHR